MTCLAAAAYDPAVAVSQSTAALLAMTALDTTNLRLTFTAPASGNVLVRIKGQVHGATTYPRILLGVLDGATLRGRQSPAGSFPQGLVTTMVGQEASYVITGLTPGNSYTWDAAYGVDIILAATGLKYGGPDDAVGNDAFGAFNFEVWDAANLLAGTFYDPLVSVTKATTALLAMTALDTTNLRLTFTAPASGKVMWRLRTVFHGSSTAGQPLLGVLEGATVVARADPVMAVPETSAGTSGIVHEASGVITGIGAGSHTYDAAYAVQTVASAGGLKWGGPNDAVTNNCFGGVAFELWTA